MSLVKAITSKGQITIPLEIRKYLGLKTKDKVVFQVKKGEVRLKPVSMTIETAFASVEPLNKPEDFKYLKEKALKEKILKK